MLSSFAVRLSARPRRTLLLVALFVLVAGALGGPVAGLLQTSGGFAPPDSGSVRAVERIAQATGLEAAPGIVLLVDTPSGAQAPAARTRVAAVAGELRAQPGVAQVAATPGASTGPLVARDGRSALVAGTLSATADPGQVVADVEARFTGQRDVTLGGQEVASEQIGGAVSSDLARAELIALPVLLLLSLLFFRGARAALIPLAVGVTTVLGTFLVLRGINEAYGLSIFALNLVIGLGLGLAIDYALFMVTRYREELAEHGPGPVAVARTMATAGRTVLFSAVTVAIALATLVVFPLGFVKSMGIAGAVVALVAAAATLTIVPALLGAWGAKLAVRPRAAGAERDGRWYVLSHAVMRRPGAVAAVTTVLMLLVALPALRAQFTPVDGSVIPQGQSSRTVSDRLAADFPQQQTQPLTVVLDAPPAAGAQVAAYAGELAERRGVTGVAAPQRLDGSTWRLDATVAGPPEGEQARALVTELRAEGAPTGPVLVAGAAADFVDQQAAIGSRLLLAIALLAALTFLVLWLMTGSVILPLKALVMNALTVGAALGVLTLIFQDGRLTGLLGYTPNGGVEPTDFLVAAALIFALSTDYGVFLLGRIKEAREQGHGEREAVAIGLERTGAVVTAAAILLAVAIGSFVTSSISFIQQIGVATAAGVLIDAFVVRALLVPALMGLLGRWNWWSPAPLRRLHERIGLREDVPPVAPERVAVPA